MKCGLRFKALAGTVLFCGLIIIVLVLEDKCETYDPVGYIQASIPWGQEEEAGPPPLVGGEPKDQIIVIPSLEEEDTSWVTDELPEYDETRLLMRGTY